MTTFGAVSRAGLKVYIRDPAAVFFTFVFPLVFLVIFGLVFGSEHVGRGSTTAVNYIAPGVLSWGMANAALFGTAFTLMQWRRDDLLRLIRLTPARLIDLGSSRLAISLAIGLAQMILFVGVAKLPVFGLATNPRWPLALPILVLAVTAFLGLGVVVGNVARTPESVAAIANFIMVPMAFLSGAFVPLALMPSWIRGLSYALPLRYAGDGLVYAFSGQGSAGAFGLDCLALAAFAAAFAAVGVRTFRWSNEG